MVIVCVHMALGDEKTDNTHDFFYLNKLEIAERMYKICLFVIVLGLGAPMVSWRVFVQEKVTVRATHTPQTCQAHATISIQSKLAPVFQNLYPVDKTIQSWFTVYLTFICCQ